MKPKVFIAKPVPKAVEELIAQHCEYEMWPSNEAIPRNILLEKIAEVDGVMLSGNRVDREFLAKAPKLKVVSCVSVGYNNLDLEAMKEKNIMGTHTPQVLDDTTADLVFALVLATARRIPELDKYVKEGKWQKGSDEHLFGVDVHHATLGIIGMGRIGEAIARRAKLGFDMEVLYYNRRRKEETEQALGIKYSSLENLLKEADFVVLMTPLTPETTGFMDREKFALMKKSAIFVNASRGQTVDEEALIEALEQGVIRGAGLDVYQKEPVDPNNPLLKMNNVVTLPHIGSATAQTRFAMAMLAAKNLVAALDGKVPPNLVEELK